MIGETMSRMGDSRRRAIRRICPDAIRPGQAGKKIENVDVLFALTRIVAEASVCIRRGDRSRRSLDQHVIRSDVLKRQRRHVGVS